MTNALFVNYKDLLLGAGTHSFVDWDGDNIKAVLIDETDVTPNPATHVDYDEIDADPVAVSSNMTTVVISAGAVDFDNFSFPTVSGDAADSLVFFKDSGAAPTSPLIFYIDTASGLPVTPNGGDINVNIDPAGLIAF